MLRADRSTRSCTLVLAEVAGVSGWTGIQGLCAHGGDRGCQPDVREEQGGDTLAEDLEQRTVGKRRRHIVTAAR